MAAPIPVLLNGALGKMGAEIAAVVLADSAVRLCAAVERPGHPRLGDDYGMCIGKGPIGLRLTDAIDAGTAKGVVVDFSSPQSVRALLPVACRTQLPVVVGTTALSAGDDAAIRDAARAIPVLVSPNMSLGVNLLFSLTELVGRRLGNDFDIEIIEAHHRFKKDSPSGTARRLGEIAAKACNLSYDNAVRNGRAGINEAGRPKNEIGMHAVRGGDIVGDHTVLFAGMGERIELRHMAHSRRPLAAGAVAAAKWLAVQKPGLYSMKDMLGL